LAVPGKRKTIDKIELSARGQAEYSFEGYIYIVEGDWRIYSVDLRLTNKTNRLNLVIYARSASNMLPIRIAPGCRQLYYDYNGNIFGFKSRGYYIGIYNNYKFNVEVPKVF